LQLNKLELDGDVSTDTPTSGRVRLGENTGLVIKTAHGWVKLGPLNTSWSHFYTDRSQFYFDKQVAVNGDLRPYTDSVRNLGTSTYAWAKMYADSIYRAGTEIDSRYCRPAAGSGWASSNKVLYSNLSGNRLISESSLSISQLLESLMYGSSNKTWVPVIFEGTLGGVGNVGFTSMRYRNVNANDDYWYFALPLATQKGTLKLYIDDAILHITQADSTNYVRDFGVYGMSRTSSVQIIEDSTDRKTAGDYTYASNAIDVSSYEVVRVYLRTYVSNASNLRISSIELGCYYA